MGLKITTGIQPSYTKAVIYGVEGIGKSTLASKLPKPLFVDVEGGTNQLKVDRVSPKTHSEILQLIANLKADQVGYKTLVIDTADWMEKLILRHIIDSAGDKINSIEDFGYGKGYTMVEETWAKFLDKLNELPMDVVLLAHSELKKFEQPQEQGSYDRYTMKLSKKGNAILKEWPDALLLANYKTLVETDEMKKAKAHGQKRTLYTTHHASWDAKNRFGLKDELPMEIKSIAHIFGQMKGAAKKQATPAKEAMKKAEVTEKVKKETKPTGKLQELETLMEMAGITPAAVEAFIVSKGVCPAGTSYKLFNKATLTQLVGSWDVNVLEMDEVMKEEGRIEEGEAVEPNASPLDELFEEAGITPEQLQAEVESNEMGSGPYSEYPESLIKILTTNWADVVQSIKGE